MTSIAGFLLTIFTRSYDAVYRWGYIGLFVISMIETGSMSTFPLPTLLFIFTFGGVLNPFMVGIASGLGAAIGSLSGYIFGRGFKDIAEKRYGHGLDKLRKKFEKHKGFWWIVVLGGLPGANNILALFCGIIKYDFKKYILASLISKLTINLFFAYAGYYSIEWISRILELKLPLVT